MFCGKCGNKIDEGARFCLKCGNPLESDSLPKKSPEKAECLHGRTASTAAVLTDGNGFAQQWLMPIIIAGLFIIFIVIGGSANYHFFAERNIENIFNNFFSYSILAMIIVLSIRAKGIDLSFFGILSVSSFIIAYFDCSFLGVLLAIAVCAVFGLINGVLVNYLRIPSIFATFFVGLLLRSFGNFLYETVSYGYFIQVYNHTDNVYLLTFILAVIVIGVTVLLLSVGRLKKSREEHGSEDKSFANVAVYMITAAFSGLYALYYCNRVHTNFIGDFNYLIPLIVFVVLIIYGVIHTRKRILAVPFAALAALFYATADNVFSIVNFGAYVSNFFIFILAIALLIVFAIVNRKRFSDFILLKSKTK